MVMMATWSWQNEAIPRGRCEATEGRQKEMLLGMILFGLLGATCLLRRLLNIQRFLVQKGCEFNGHFYLLSDISPFFFHSYHVKNLGVSPHLKSPFRASYSLLFPGCLVCAKYRGMVNIQILLGRPFCSMLFYFIFSHCSRLDWYLTASLQLDDFCIQNLGHLPELFLFGFCHPFFVGQVRSRLGCWNTSILVHKLLGYRWQDYPIFAKWWISAKSSLVGWFSTFLLVKSCMIMNLSIHDLLQWEVNPSILVGEFIHEFFLSFPSCGCKWLCRTICEFQALVNTMPIPIRHVWLDPVAIKGRFTIITIHQYFSWQHFKIMNPSQSFLIHFFHVHFFFSNIFRCVFFSSSILKP